MTSCYLELGESRSDRWAFAAGQLELLEATKEKAKNLACGISSC